MGVERGRVLCLPLSLHSHFSVPLESLRLNCSKKVVAGLNKANKMAWLVSQNTIKILSMFERREEFMASRVFIRV